MDYPLLHRYEPAARWRRVTILALGLAGAEFVIIVALGVVLLGGVLSHAIARNDVPVRTPAREHVPRQASTPKAAPAPVERLRPRDLLRVMVLNGNGRAGAAGRAAAALHRLGYSITGTANARRQNYPTSLVLYRPGYRTEGVRLAHDLGAATVAPLDGMLPASLHGGDFAVILGN